LHPLNLLFEAGEWVLFDAQRQPCKNDCRYMATHVQKLPYEYAEMESRKSPDFSKEMSKKNGIGDLTKKKLDDEQNSTALAYEEGEIARLFTQYGFIRSETLGTVYFTLAHFESETYITNLSEILSVGDRVRFLPMSQPEKNGCRWRGLKVQRLDFDSITPLAQLVDQECSIEENGDRILCEVSVQTDQSLWNTFLATQASSTYRRRENRTVKTENAACQTRMPPEALLLKAVKEDDELKAILKERFPHLMQFVEKTT